MDTDAGTAALMVRNFPGKVNSSIRFDVLAGLTIQEAILSIQLPVSQPLACLVNGSTAEMSYILQPGDIVDLLPQIGGGCY